MTLKAGVIATAFVAALLAPTGSATAATVSNLIATPNPVSLTVGGAAQPVSVVLDSNCPNALNNGLTYSVATGAYNTSVVTVSGTSGSYHCGDAGATFTFTPVACGSTSVTFQPVVGNRGGVNPAGAQKKVGPVTVPVTVTDPNNPSCLSTGGGGGGDRPAAPAVANMYLNSSDAAYTKACRQHVGNTNNWRGIVISDIAGWMPLPESIKDDPSVFPDDASWVNYVTAQVDYYCGASSTPQPSMR
ncbi:MAG: hypothetical protein ACTHOG_11855 [Marmoricola sp.]